MNKDFYICKKIKMAKSSDSLLFFHVPKCAGTTFSVIFSWLIQPQTRLKGPLFENNDKGGETAFKLFNRCENYSFYNRFKLIYGHLPFESSNFLEKPFKKITALREPISRSISHYNWMLNRGYCNKRDDLQELFDNNKITKNTITNQFSGVGYTNKNSYKALSLAYSNISDNIDYLYDSGEIFYLFKFLISKYNLPNLVIQNQQESIYNNNYDTSKFIEVIKKNNEMDMELFDMLITNKKFSKGLGYGVEIEDSDYFFSSPNLKYNNKNNTKININQYKELLIELKKNNYKIKIVK